MLEISKFPIYNYNAKGVKSPRIKKKGFTVRNDYSIIQDITSDMRGKCKSQYIKG